MRIDHQVALYEREFCKAAGSAMDPSDPPWVLIERRRTGRTRPEQHHFTLKTGDGRSVEYDQDEARESITAAAHAAAGRMTANA